MLVVKLPPVGPAKHRLNAYGKRAFERDLRSVRSSVKFPKVRRAKGTAKQRARLAIDRQAGARGWLADRSKVA